MPGQNVITVSPDPGMTEKNPRTLKFQQTVAAILNSMLREGIIVPGAPGEWVISDAWRLNKYGVPGRDGDDGDQGPPGVGIQGLQGAPGQPIYLPGDDGEHGLMGPPGIAGATVPAGTPINWYPEEGEEGQAGIPGQIGPAGTNAATNLLINGSFRLYQRQTPGTLTTIAADKYGPDRWRSGAQNADVQAQRVDSSGASPSGTTSRYNGLYKKITNTGKFFFCQPVEGELTCSQQGKTVTFQIMMKASASKTIRLGVLNSTNAIDTIPVNIVPTTWGANSTDPTWGTGLALIAPVAVPGPNGTINGSAVDCAVTTAFQLFSVTVSVPTSCVNLIPIVWTDSQFAAADTLSMAEAGLYQSAVIQAWIPRSAAHEDVLAQRFYEKSWNVDTTPGAGWTLGNFNHVMILATQAATGTTGIVSPFNVRKRANPTATFYDSAGTTGKADFFNGAVWAAGGAIGAGALEHGILCQVSTCGAIQFAFTAEAEL